MSAKPPFEIQLVDDDIYRLTPQGEKELKGSETGLSRIELEVLVLSDGTANVGQVKARARDIPAPAVTTALKTLIGKKLLESTRTAANVGGPDVIDVGDFLKTGTFYVSQSNAPTPEQEGEASEGSSSLQRDGYFVRIARRPATERKPAAGAKFTAVVVEDEPHLAKLLRSLLSIEGFETRIAGTRAEVQEALRRTPVPELILLDVVLPDADGFDILGKLRHHPAFTRSAIIMLTGQATREAVLRGLARGADGYITKPFEVDVLMKAVNAVLGRAPK